MNERGDDAEGEARGCCGSGHDERLGCDAEPHAPRDEPREARLERQRGGEPAELRELRVVELGGARVGLGGEHAQLGEGAQRLIQVSCIGRLDGFCKQLAHPLAGGGEHRAQLEQ